MTIYIIYLFFIYIADEIIRLFLFKVGTLHAVSNLETIMIYCVLGAPMKTKFLLPLLTLFVFSCNNTKELNSSRVQSVQVPGIEKCPNFSIGLSIRNLTKNKTAGVDGYEICSSSDNLNKVFTGANNLESFLSEFPLTDQGLESSFVTQCIDKYIREKKDYFSLRESYKKYTKLSSVKKGHFKRSVVADYYYAMAQIKGISLGYLEVIANLSHLLGKKVNFNELSADWVRVLQGCNTSLKSKAENLISNTTYVLTKIHSIVIAENLHKKEDIRAASALHFHSHAWLKGEHMQKLVQPENFYENVEKHMNTNNCRELGICEARQRHESEVTYWVDNNTLPLEFGEPIRKLVPLKKDNVVKFMQQVLGGKRDDKQNLIAKVRTAFYKQVEETLGALIGKYKLFKFHAELMHDSNLRNRRIKEHAQFLDSIEKISMEDRYMFEDFLYQKKEYSQDYYSNIEQVHFDLNNTFMGAKCRSDFLAIREERHRIAKDYVIGVGMTLATAGISSWGAALIRGLTKYKAIASTAGQSALGYRYRIAIAQSIPKAVLVNAASIGVGAAWTGVDVAKIIDTCERRVNRNLDISRVIQVEQTPTCTANGDKIFGTTHARKNYYQCFNELAITLSIEAVFDVLQAKELVDLYKGKF